MRRFTVVVASVSVAAFLVSCSGGRGADGSDGTSCKVSRTGSNVVITCEDGTTETLVDGATGATGKNGADGEDGATGNDGVDGVDGIDGIDGVNGLNGQNALVALVDEAAGVNCAVGGTKVMAGLDANANQVLDAAEVSSVRYVCNGLAGAVGAAGRTSIVNTTTEAAGSNCPEGGVRIDVGFDDDKSGTLEPLEIARTSYLCESDCVVVNSKVTLAASVTGSLDYSNNVSVDANALISSTSSTADSVGWIGFPLAGLTSDRAVVGMRLYVRHLPGADSPTGTPTLRVVHGPSTAFTRTGLSTENMPRGRFVSAPIAEFNDDGWTEISLDIDTDSFAVDRTNGFLSLGLDEVTTPTQSIQFYGADAPATRPYLEVETLRCAP